MTTFTLELYLNSSKSDASGFIVNMTSEDGETGQYIEKHPGSININLVEMKPGMIYSFLSWAYQETEQGKACSSTGQTLLAPAQNVEILHATETSLQLKFTEILGSRYDHYLVKCSLVLPQGLGPSVESTCSGPPCTCTSLQPAHTYQISITTRRAGFQSVQVTTKGDTLPLPPTVCNTSTINETSIQMYVYLDPATNIVHGYQVRYMDEDNTVGDDIHLFGQGPHVYNLTGLISGTGYTFFTRSSYNLSESSPCNSTGFTYLAKPTDVNVVAQENSLTVTFEAADGNKDGYTMNCTALISNTVHTGSCTNSSCICTNLQPATAYQISLATIRKDFPDSEAVYINKTTASPVDPCVNHKCVTGTCVQDGSGNYTCNCNSTRNVDVKGRYCDNTMTLSLDRNEDVEEGTIKYKCMVNLSHNKTDNLTFLWRVSGNSTAVDGDRFDHGCPGCCEGPRRCWDYLQISPLKLQDSGLTVSCDVSYTEWLFSTNKTLYVLAKPVVNLTMAPEGPAVPGELVNLTCSAFTPDTGHQFENETLLLDWYADGQRITPTTIQTTSSPLFTNPTQDPNHGQDFVFTDVWREGDKTYYQSMMYQMRNKSTEFTCVATNSKQSSAQRNATVLTLYDACKTMQCHNGGVCQRFNGDARCVNCTAGYTGKHCEIAHNVTMTMEGTAYQDTNITYQCVAYTNLTAASVQFNWSFSESLLNKSVVTGRTGSLTCSGHRCSSLHIESLSVHDQGLILCEAYLKVGDSSYYLGNQSAMLAVLGVPLVNLDSPESVWPGQRVNVTCNATTPQTGHPLQNTSIYITWLNGSHEILPGSDVSIRNWSSGVSSWSRIELPAGVPDSTNTIMCSAANPAGTSDRSAVITVARESTVSGPTTQRPTTETSPKTTRIGDAPSSTPYITTEEPCLCENGATCKRRPGVGFDCLCPKGYTGDKCEFRITGNVTVTTDALDSKEGGRASFSCRCTIDPLTPDKVTFRWYSSGVQLSQSPKYNIKTKERCSGDLCQNMTINHLRVDDTGTVECRVFYEDYAVNSSSVTFHLLAAPRVVVHPTTVSVKDKEATVITCRGVVAPTGHPRENNDLNFTWSKDNGIITGNSDYEIRKKVNGRVQESELTIKRVSSNNTYICRVQNEAGEDSGLCQVTAVPPVPPDQPKTTCDAEVEAGISWTLTLQGVTAVEPCPSGQIGQATRMCCMIPHKDAEWEAPNLVDCKDESFQDAVNEADRISEGTGAADDSRVEKVTEDIENITKADAESDEGMKPGNINAAAEALEKIAVARSRFNNATVTTKETQSVATTIGTLLDDKNGASWSQVEQADPGRGVRVVETAENYGQMYSRSIPPGENKTIPADNLVMQVKAADPSDPEIVNLPIPDPNVPEWVNDKVKISKELITEIGDKKHTGRVSVSCNIYKTAQQMFPAHGMGNLKVSSVEKVMSVSFAELPNATELENPLEAMYSKTKDLAENETTVCGHWVSEEGGRGNWSDSGCTTAIYPNGTTQCTCNHTTNFAILVSSKPITDNPGLNLASMICLALSMIALIITIMVYLCLWKNLKAHTTVLLLNLCVALTVANGLFLFGVTRAAGQKVACRIIGVFLHYFFLVVFFVMLAEGVYCLLTVTAVFHKWRNRETGILVLLSWLLPAVVVGITYGVSQGQAYTTEKYCWLSVNDGYLLAFVAPMASIIVINFVILFVVLYKSCQVGVNDNRKKKVRRSLWNIGVLAPLLGLSWTFGLFTLTADPTATLVFQWVFSITNALQGVFIFVFHCLLNVKLRDAVKSKVSSTMSTESSSQRRQRKKYTKSSDGSYPMESSESYQMSERRGMMDPNPRQRLHRRENLDNSNSSGGFSDIVASTSAAVQETEWRKLMRDRVPSFDLDSTEEVPLHRRKLYDDSTSAQDSFRSPKSFTSRSDHTSLYSDNYNFRHRITNVGHVNGAQLDDSDRVCTNDKRKSEEEKFVDSNFAFLAIEQQDALRDDQSSIISERSRFTNGTDLDQYSLGRNGEPYKIPRPVIFTNGGLKDDVPSRFYEAQNHAYQQDEYF